MQVSNDPVYTQYPYSGYLFDSAKPLCHQDHLLWRGTGWLHDGLDSVGFTLEVLLLFSVVFVKQFCSTLFLKRSYLPVSLLYNPFHFQLRLPVDARLDAFKHGPQHIRGSKAYTTRSACSRNLRRHVNRVRDSSSVSAATKDAKKKTPEDLQQSQKSFLDPAVECNVSCDLSHTRRPFNCLEWPQSDHFDPTVFVAWDLHLVNLPACLIAGWCNLISVVRTETDVVMLMNLIIYFTTSVPSMLYLYYRFSCYHGFCIGWCNPTTSAPTPSWFSQVHLVWSYLPLYHGSIYGTHVELVLLSSCKTSPYWTRWARWSLVHDSLSTRRSSFTFFITWADSSFSFGSVYHFNFKRKKKTFLALKTVESELPNYLMLYLLTSRANLYATIYTFLLPFLLLRLSLMAGNWCQHALVDEVDPDSDFRSSITLIDVAVNLEPWAPPCEQLLAISSYPSCPSARSNRYYYNDGYQTSHHLNPRHHWVSSRFHRAKGDLNPGKRAGLLQHWYVNKDKLLKTYGNSY